MPRYHLFDIIADVYSANVDGPVLPHETPHASHVVSVVGMLVPPENIDVRVEHIVNPRKPVQVLAPLAIWTYPSREEKAEVAPVDLVGFGVSSIVRNITAPRRRGLR